MRLGGLPNSQKGLFLVIVLVVNAIFTSVVISSCVPQARQSDTAGAQHQNTLAHAANDQIEAQVAEYETKENRLRVGFRCCSDRTLPHNTLLWLLPHQVGGPGMFTHACELCSVVERGKDKAPTGVRYGLASTLSGLSEVGCLAEYNGSRACLTCSKSGMMGIVVCDQCLGTAGCVRQTLFTVLYSNAKLNPQFLLPVEPGILHQSRLNVQALGYGVSAAESEFRYLEHKLLADYDLRPALVISGHLYDLVHLLPLGMSMPTTKFYSSTPQSSPPTSEQYLVLWSSFLLQLEHARAPVWVERNASPSMNKLFKGLIQRNPNQFLMASTEAAPVLEWRRNGARSRMGPQLCLTAHGNDEDGWGSNINDECMRHSLAQFPNPEKKLELQFTKSVHRWMTLMQRDARQIKEQFNLHPSKEVVLVIDGVIGDMDGVSGSLVDHSFLAPSLIALKAAGYEVLYLPHPLSIRRHLRVAVIHKLLSTSGIHVGHAESYPSKLGLWEVADVIIGVSSGAFLSATFSPSKPLVLFRPSTFYNSSYCKRCPWWPLKDQVLMGEEQAVLFTEKDVDFVRDVNAAKLSTNEKTRAKGEYFERWRGRIDGYEDYRLAICLLEELGPQPGSTNISHQVQDVFKSRIQELKQAYRQFPPFKGRPSVDPSAPESCSLSHFTPTEAARKLRNRTEIICFCTTPNQGAAGHNRYECNDGTIAHCATWQACRVAKFHKATIDQACV